MEKKENIPEQTEKNLQNDKEVKSSPHDCCGGAPVNNSEACCKADEDKKREGNTGCGCKPSANDNNRSSCC